MNATMNLTMNLAKNTTTKTILRSKELSCPSCVPKIEKSLKRVEGVEDATVYFNTGRIEVIHDPVLAPSSKLIAAVRAAGYESTVSPF